ncbi:MAG: hypothetical protein PHN78_03115 [Dehalococcoidales bacterium]|nr:hypothetical protein [Dehalococcoidales bacterium]
MNDALLLILVVIVVFVIVLVIPQWFIRRATQDLLIIFKNYDAIGLKNAKTLYDLGFRSPGLLKRMLIPGRDYKGAALNLLMQLGIVEKTEDDRYYLLEDKLYASKLYQSNYINGKDL